MGTFQNISRNFEKKMKIFALLAVSVFAQLEYDDLGNKKNGGKEVDKGPRWCANKAKTRRHRRRNNKVEMYIQKSIQQKPTFDQTMQTQMQKRNQTRRYRQGLVQEWSLLDSSQ